MIFNLNLNLIFFNNRSEDNINTITLLMESISGPAILAISDGLDGFCFLEASIIQPLPYIRAFGNRSK